MVLYEESGIDGENFAVSVKLYAIAGTHIAFTCQVGDKLILEVANGDEGCRIVRYFCLKVYRTLEYPTILSDIILGVGDHRDPLTAI
jgi:hypothetical protein